MNLNMHFLGEMHVYFKGRVIILKVLFEPCILYLIKFVGINYTLVVVFNNCALDETYGTGFCYYYYCNY